MASQITHVPYGKKALEMFLGDQQIDERKFYLGTLFPDIRYLGVIAREVTHQGEISVKEIRQAENDFEKGRLVHCLVDVERDSWVRKLKIDKLVEAEPMVPAVMKYLEDEITYPLFNDWSKIREYLEGGVLEEERQFVTKEKVERWHMLLSEYFAEQPTFESALKVAVNLTLTQEQLAEAQKLVEILRENVKLRESLKLIYKSLFSDYPAEAV